MTHSRISMIQQTHNQQIYLNRKSSFNQMQTCYINNGKSNSCINFDHGSRTSYKLFHSLKACFSAKSLVGSSSLPKHVVGEEQSQETSFLSHNSHHDIDNNNHFFSLSSPSLHCFGHPKLATFCYIGRHLGSLISYMFRIVLKHLCLFFPIVVLRFSNTHLEWMLPFQLDTLSRNTYNTILQT